MLSIDSGFYKALLFSPSFTSNIIIPDSLALEVYYWSHLGHYSLPILNDLAGALEKLFNDALVVGWMPSLAGALVASGTVIKGTNFSKVQFGASTHASDFVSDRLINELPPDPVAVLLHLPVLEPAEKLTPPLAHTRELLLQATATVSNPLPYLGVG